MVGEGKHPPFGGKKILLDNNFAPFYGGLSKTAIRCIRQPHV